MTRAAALDAPVKERRKKTVSLDKKKARAGWIFVLPFVIGFVLIYLPMIMESISYTFNKVSWTALTGEYRLEGVGFANYREVLFSNSEFVQNLLTGMQQLVLDVPAIIIFSLFMAVILNQKMVGRAVFRAIFFIPVIISTGIIAEINASTAALNNYASSEVSTGNNAQGSSSATELISAADISNLFSGMAVGGELVSYVVDIINNIYNIVNRSGVQMLIFLAGLQSISPAIYESCSIDGATAWETFWKITFPMISPMILVNAVYTIIDSFTSQNNTTMIYITQQFTKANASSEQATTMAWIYFAIVILIVAVVAGIVSSFIFYQRKDG